jgi:hypothetical protein
MTNFTVPIQPVRILDGYQADGVTLTNVGATPIYINNNSSVTTINQVIDIGGSMYFEPYTEVWATVPSASVQGQLTATFDASDRFSNVAPGITFIGTFGMTSAGSSINYAFDIGSSAGSQFQAFKIVARFPNGYLTPTTSGDYEYVIGAKLNGLGVNTQTLQSSILIDATVSGVPSNAAPGYVIIPLTGATSGTLFITPPANTNAVGDMVMDVYGLTHSPAQLIAWSDPSITLRNDWIQRGSTWILANPSISLPATYYLPAMGANFTIGVTTGGTATSLTAQLVSWTTAPASSATKYYWDSALISYSGASALTTSIQRTYYTTPGVPLALLIIPTGGSFTGRIWIQNNAQIGA